MDNGKKKDAGAKCSANGKLPHLRALTRAFGLNGEGFRIALYLILRLSEEKLQWVSEDEIAEAIQTSQSNVSRSIGRIEKQKLVVAKQSKGDKRRLVYKLPNMRKKGGAVAKKPTTDEWDDN